MQSSRATSQAAHDSSVEHQKQKLSSRLKKVKGATAFTSGERMSFFGREGETYN